MKHTRVFIYLQPNALVCSLGTDCRTQCHLFFVVSAKTRQGSYPCSGVVNIYNPSARVAQSWDELKYVAFTCFVVYLISVKKKTINSISSPR